MRKSVFSVSLLSAVLVLGCAMQSTALDIKPKQVFIGAKIVEITDTELEGFGIDFGAEWDANALNNSETFNAVGKWDYVASGGIMNLDEANAFDANIGLRVTPTITETDKITLKFGAGLNITGVEDYQVEDTLTQTTQDMYTGQIRTIETKVLVEERDSVLLGGIYGEVVVESSKVPLLGDLPVVGRLFASAPVTDNEGEYLVFITAGITFGGDAE